MHIDFLEKHEAFNNATWKTGNNWCKCHFQVFLNLFLNIPEILGVDTFLSDSLPTWHMKCNIFIMSFLELLWNLIGLLIFFS